MNIDYTVTALMFPAIPLIMSVYSNRFHTLSSLIRKIHDEFVFEIHADKTGILAPVAQGGRYDELTKFFNKSGDGENVLSAVGGIIRPEILIDLKD